MRGRADQTAVVYDLLAPIVVAGEESPDESAVRERSIELLFSKKDTLSVRYWDSFVWVSDNAKLLSAFGRSLLDTALDTMPGEVQTWFEEGRGFFDSKLPMRVRDNLCCLYAGLSLIVKLCGRLGVSWNEAFPLDREACVKYIEYAAREYLLDGGTNNRSVVEQTFEVMARMKQLKQGEDYAFENGCGQLLLWLGGDVYDRYTRYRRDSAIAGEVLPLNQFKKQLQHSEFFIEKDRQKRLDKNKKVWVIDFVKLSQRCEVSGFIKEEAGAPDSDQLALSM